MNKLRVMVLAAMLAISMFPAAVFAAPATGTADTFDWSSTYYSGNSASALSITFTDDLQSDLTQLAKVKTYYTDLQYQTRYAGLLMDAGNYSCGTPYETVYTETAPELRVMDQTGYDLIGVGTRELSQGLDGFDSMLRHREDQEKEAAVPAYTWGYVPLAPAPAEMICSNVKLAGKNAGKLPDYTILTAETKRVAVISLVDPETVAAFGVSASDPVKTAKKLVKKITEKESPQMIVCLYSNSGDESFSVEKKLAGKVSGLDLIISSGSGKTLTKAISKGKATIVSAGDSKHIGTAAFLQQDDGMSLLAYRISKLDSKVAPDAAVAEAAAEYTGSYDSQYFKKYGYSYGEDLAEIETKIAGVKGSSSNEPFGNLLADAYRYTASKHGDADIAIVSGRAAKGKKLPAGTIETRDIYAMFSGGTGSDGHAGTGITRAVLKGDALRALVNEGAEENLGEEQLYFSGIQCTYNKHHYGEEKIYDVQFVPQKGNAQAIDAERSYSVVMDGETAEVLRKAYPDQWKAFTSDDGEPLAESNGEPVMRSKSREVKRWTALSAYVKKLGGETIQANYGEMPARITYDHSKSIRKVFKEHEKTLGVFISIIVIILCLLILLILFVRRWKRPKNAFPRSSSHGHRTYSRGRKQKPIFSNRKNRFK